MPLVASLEKLVDRLIEKMGKQKARRLFFGLWGDILQTAASLNEWYLSSDSESYTFCMKNSGLRVRIVMLDDHKVRCCENSYGFSDHKDLTRDLQHRFKAERARPFAQA